MKKLLKSKTFLGAILSIALCMSLIRLRFLASY